MSAWIKSGSLIGVLALASVAGASSGHETGNGGDAVYCEGEGTARAELLDVYESREIHEFILALGDGGEHYAQKLSFVLEKLKSLSPDRYVRYREHLDGFFSEAVFVDEELPDIPDSAHIGVPRGCRIRQVVIQKTSPAQGEPRYTINRSLWELLDENNKAGLLLHEIVYREALEIGHENSVSTRALNSVLISTELDFQGLGSWARLLRSLKFRDLDILTPEGFLLHTRVDLGDDQSWSRDSIGMIFVSEAVFFQQTVALNGFVHFNERHLDRVDFGSVLVTWKNPGRELRISGPAVLHPNGSLAQARLFDPVRFEGAYSDLSCTGGLAFLAANGGLLGCELRFNATHKAMVHGRWTELAPTYDCAGIWLTREGRVSCGLMKGSQNFALEGIEAKLSGMFSQHENGRILAANLAEEVAFRVRGRELRFAPGRIEFRSDESLRAGRLAADYVLPLAKGGTRAFKKGQWVSFDIQGRVEAWSG